jgi:hypothetical protein
MKESPIIFSTEMVQAILEGRKTQTRRKFKCKWRHDIEDGKAYIEDEDGLWPEVISPYGDPGDLLWVRETFCIDSRGAHEDDPGYYYKADMPTYEDGQEIWPDSWKTSIYMPKAAARLWLQITDVKVERLQDISVDDSISEGIEIDQQTPIGPLYKDYFQKKWKDVYANPQNSFKSLWRNINGENSWDANPWVWVIKFKVRSTTGKPTTTASTSSAASAASAAEQQ